MSRPSPFPTLTYSFSRQPPLSIEVDIHPDDHEGWELFALLKQAPVLARLTQKALPLLEAQQLIAPDPAITELLERLSELPQAAQNERDTFLRDRDYGRLYRKNLFI